MSRRGGKSKPRPRLRAGGRFGVSLGSAGALGAAVWLLGFPTTPGPFAPTPGYGISLAVLAATAILPFFLLARGDSEALAAELKRRSSGLMIVGGLTAGLLACEFGVRVSGRAEWGGGQGPLQPSFGLKRYRINREGFRGPDMDSEREKGKRVLMGLGDSFTFGQGVAFEETFLQRLEGALNAAGGPGRVVTVNAAKPGWNTAQELRYLLEGGFERHRPRALVLQFTLNDAEIQPYYLEPVTGWPEFEMRTLWRSHLFFMLVKAFNLKTRPYEVFIRGLYADGSPGWELFRRSLARIASECRARRVYPVFVLFPILQDLDRYGFEDIHAKVAEEARSRGFKVVDLLAAYRAHPSPTKSLRVSPGDWHPNAEGHRIAAEAILPALLQRPSGPDS